MINYTDPVFKASKAIRNLVRTAIKRMGYTKNNKTEKILGCNFEEFKAHIEKQFNLGMTWLNHGDWHIDHKVPISLAKTEEDAIKLNRYTNLQPLWKEDNLIKHDSLLPEFEELAEQLLNQEEEINLIQS
jgi:hypothetical protein